MLVADTTKRLGCMKDGAAGIKEHKWFTDDFSWATIEGKSAKPFYVPKVKDPGDTDNFSSYPDSPEDPVPVLPEDDPFVEW